MNSLFLKRCVGFFLIYIKVWYSVWALVALVSLIASFFLEGVLEIKDASFFLSSILILINASIYFKIADYLKVLFFNQVKKSRNIFKNLSICFGVLFVTDLFSFFNAKLSSETDDLYSRFLDVSTADSTIDEFIKFGFKYFPILYDFFSPRIEGVTLLIVAIAQYYFAASGKSEEPLIINQ